jgi:hypothetical protein
MQCHPDRRDSRKRQPGEDPRVSRRLQRGFLRQGATSHRLPVQLAWSGGSMAGANVVAPPFPFTGRGIRTPADRDGPLNPARVRPGNTPLASSSNRYPLPLSRLRRRRRAGFDFPRRPMANFTTGSENGI